MLELLPDLPEGVVGVRAHDRVSREDYEAVLVPLLARVRDEGRRIRFLYEFAADFAGFTAGAALADLRLGLSTLRLFERCAVVTDVAWLRESVAIFGALLPFTARTFPLAERDAAVAWLAAEPSAQHLSFRLLTDRGVVVLEPRGPLAVEDFDAVALTVDPWIEAHGRLHGLVLRADQFPGWENLGGLARHVRFVREHHRRIERVALVGDAALFDVAPRFAEHFIAAELKHFAHDRLDDAIAWAAGSPDAAQT